MSSSTEFPTDETPSPPAPRGRRPGKADTRAAIVAAASKAFAEDGYAEASLRGIAQRAGVDPALVHHYFDGKAALFVEVMGLPRDVAEIREEVNRASGSQGTVLVERFIRFWDEDPSRGRSTSFLSLMQAVSSSRQAADSLIEFLTDRMRIWSQVAHSHSEEESHIRRSLVASQLVGLGFVRYVLRLEPAASADAADVARWVGPAIDRYMDGPLDAAPFS